MKLVLVALKCDLRASSDDENDGAEDNPSQPGKERDMIDYKEGLEVARRIHALRYLGIIALCSVSSLNRSPTKCAHRVFSQTESRGERSIYRSCESSTFG